jgi:uncharacterized membrane protein required for colicin V production
MGLSDLHTFDYIIVTILGLSIYLGWKNGLIQTFIAFFAWVGSAIIVADNYIGLFNFLNSFIPSRFISGFIASVGLYVALVIGISMLGERCSKKVSKFEGGSTDKVTGGVFGAFAGFLVVCTLFWVSYITLYTLNDQKLPTWFSQAKSYKILKIGSDSVQDILASKEDRAKLMNLIKKKSNKLEEEVRNNAKKKSIEVRKKREMEARERAAREIEAREEKNSSIDDDNEKDDEPDEILEPSED